MSSKIRIMLSSRNDDHYPLSSAVSLTQIRKKLKEEIEGSKLLEKEVYEVWINEAAAGDATTPSWDQCINQARECDIFIAVSNGNAGWLGTGSNATVGICQAELEAAYAAAPAKVFLVNIYQKGGHKEPKRTADLEFRKFIKGLNLMERRPKNQQELETTVKDIVVQATLELFHRGARDAKRGMPNMGSALDWSRLNYETRAAKMRESALAALGNKVPHGKDLAAPRISKKKILCVVSAIPDAMSIPMARELVGQPHLRDHSLNNNLASNDGGPVHFIACHKGVSQMQALRMLGFPDATVVSGPSWLYVVDPVQRIQLVFILQCRNDVSTRLGIQNFLAWLNGGSRQAGDLVSHARKRKAVVKALAT
jgi:hypothetical protein